LHQERLNAHWFLSKGRRASQDCRLADGLQGDSLPLRKRLVCACRIRLSMPPIAPFIGSSPARSRLRPFPEHTEDALDLVSILNADLACRTTNGIDTYGACLRQL
jgi:hypothetical protein